MKITKIVINLLKNNNIESVLYQYFIKNYGNKNIRINKLLAKADAQSILTSAIVAATLDLPVDPNLGFAYIVPYQGAAACQIGYRGYIQLALRTGQYKRFNAITVYKDQFKSYNPLTEELELDFSREEDEIVGFAVYFELVNGYRKLVYQSKKSLIAHGQKYSKTFNNGPWKTNTEEMCIKTLIKQTLKRWGILSIEMQQAVKFDDGTPDTLNLDTANVTYADSVEEAEVSNVIDIEPVKASEPVTELIKQEEELIRQEDIDINEMKFVQEEGPGF